MSITATQDLEGQRDNLQAEYDLLRAAGPDAFEGALADDIGATSAPLDLSTATRRVMYQLALQDLGHRLSQLDHQIGQPYRQRSAHL